MTSTSTPTTPAAAVPLPLPLPLWLDLDRLHRAHERGDVLDALDAAAGAHPGGYPTAAHIVAEIGGPALGEHHADEPFESPVWALIEAHRTAIYDAGVMMGAYLAATGAAPAWQTDRAVARAIADRAVSAAASPDASA